MASVLWFKHLGVAKNNLSSANCIFALGIFRKYVWNATIVLKLSQSHRLVTRKGFHVIQGPLKREYFLREDQSHQHCNYLKALGIMYEVKMLRIFGVKQIKFLFITPSLPLIQSSNSLGCWIPPKPLFQKWSSENQFDFPIINWWYFSVIHNLKHSHYQGIAENPFGRDVTWETRTENHPNTIEARKPQELS